MAKLIQKIFLILMIPLVSAFVLHQIDPKLLDPSSEKSIFSFFITTHKTKGSGLNIAGKDAPSQLLNMIWTSLALNDSLFHKSLGERDPMKPLIGLSAEARLGTRNMIAPVVTQRFPLTIADISAIIWNPRSPTVLIQGKRYQIGDEVQGARITAINQSSIEFVWRDKAYTLERSAPKINIQ